MHACMYVCTVQVQPGFAPSVFNLNPLLFASLWLGIFSAESQYEGFVPDTSVKVLNIFYVQEMALVHQIVKFF
jgi:hypothetical protein